MTMIIGDSGKPIKKKVEAPTLARYFNADYLTDVVYKNGGIQPGGAGSVMQPVAFGCGVTQEEFMMLLTFYGAMMLLAKKDPQEAELIMEELGEAMIKHYKLDDEDKAWIKEKFIDKKPKTK